MNGFENGVSIISNFIGKKCNPLLTASKSLFKYMASANSFNIILTTSARVKFDFSREFKEKLRGCSSSK